MPGRRDAFLAGAEIALAVEAAARSSGSTDTVGTVGVCDVFPGAINSVPSRTMLGVDVRDIDEPRRDLVPRRFAARAAMSPRGGRCRSPSSRSMRIRLAARRRRSSPR